MPAILTHYIAGQAVLNSLAPQIREKIKPCEQLYNLGTQGPDIFFYYLPGAMRKRSRGIGQYMHQHDLGLFLVQMAQEAKAASCHGACPGLRPGGLDPQSPPCDLQSAIFSYTAGFIMHYVVDSHTHPYVYARTEKSGASKIENSTTHHKFEAAIDNAMLKIFSGKNPAAYKLWQLIDADRTQMTAASGATSAAIRTIYDRAISQKDVRKAMRYMVQIVRLIQSRRGKRKKLMGFTEKLLFGQPLNASIIHDQDIDSSVDYLNEKNQPWQAPWESAASTDSFLDRYQAAVGEGSQIVQMLYDYVYGSFAIEDLQEKLGNRSLKTGLPCGSISCEPS